MPENPFIKIVHNAQSSKKTGDELNKVSIAKTIACPNCGAARPTDSNLVVCDYCGCRFMTNVKKLSLKNQNK